MDEMRFSRSRIGANMSCLVRVRAQQWLGFGGQRAGLEFLLPSHTAIGTDHTMIVWAMDTQVVGSYAILTGHHEKADNPD
jgi:hypothetical protein